MVLRFHCKVFQGLSRHLILCKQTSILCSHDTKRARWLRNIKYIWTTRRRLYPQPTSILFSTSSSQTHLGLLRLRFDRRRRYFVIRPSCSCASPRMSRNSSRMVQMASLNTSRWICNLRLYPYQYNVELEWGSMGSFLVIGSELASKIFKSSLGQRHTYAKASWSTSITTNTCQNLGNR